MKNYKNEEKDRERLMKNYKNEKKDRELSMIDYELLKVNDEGQIKNEE